MNGLRIGVLGAATITPTALIVPAREMDEVTVAAVAARDSARAADFATKHGIAKVHPDYGALLADPEIDAVYNPLPNGLHGRWTIAALEAGKHVLCEKPFTANAAEAEQVAAVARRAGLVVMEAFHWRYHGLAGRMMEIVASGELGDIRRIENSFCIPLPVQNVRWQLDLAGGALMDIGCYAVHVLRTLAGAEPRVVRAWAKLKSPDVDRLMQAEFAFDDGRTGGITASMLSWRLFAMKTRVIGTAGAMSVFNLVLPQYAHSLSVRTPRGRRKEQVAKQPSSYLCQLRAFTGAVLRGESFPTGVDDAIANMRVIDAIYQAAGLPARQPS